MRHKWARLREHHYVCRQCATCRVNSQDARLNWIATWHLPNGSKVVQTVTPPCEPGAITAKRLAHYGPQIEAADAAAKAAKVVA